MGNYPDGDTFNDHREASAMPFADINPTIPHATATPGEVAFATGDIRVEADGSVTTSCKAFPASDGGAGGSGGSSGFDGGSA